ncbi:MAG: foldase protein PrsA [Nannocystaceae bacterium]
MLRRGLPRPLLCLFALCLSSACDKEQPKPTPSEPAKAEANAEQPKPEQAKPDNPKVALVEGDPNEACAKILVVAYAGAEGADSAISRDKPAAKTRADDLRTQLLAGKDPSELASESDEPKTRAKQTAMGTYLKEKWPESFGELKAPVFALKIHEVSEPLDTPRGFVVAKRCPVEKVHTSHILIRYQGAKRADDDVKRSKQDAQKLAEKVRAEIASGKAFGEAAKKYGEDGSSERGGDLGPVGRGMFAIPYEKAAFALEANELSAVVETDFGFHIIQRM